MGCFNSILVECPHCQHENEDQFKPGYMKSYRFPNDVDNTPLEYLQDINGKLWQCYNCRAEFETFVTVEVKISNPIVKKSQ